MSISYTMAWSGELTSYFESNQIPKLMDDIINPAVAVSIKKLKEWIKPSTGFSEEEDDYKLLAQICNIKKPNEKAIGKQYIAKNDVKRVQSKTIKIDRDGRMILLRFHLYLYIEIN